MEIDLPDKYQLVRSLHSMVCPACGRRKKYGHTLCGRDYRALPPLMRTALYLRIGAGYERAITEAMDRLGATTFILPGDSPCRKDATATPGAGAGAGTATRRGAAS